MSDRIQHERLDEIAEGVVVHLAGDHGIADAVCRIRHSEEVMFAEGSDCYLVRVTIGTWSAHTKVGRDLLADPAAATVLASLVRMHLDRDIAAVSA